MGLGLPLALLGLVAVGIPIAIHLMRNRDLPVRPLPTVALLGRASAESRQKLRLRDRLLLMLRAGALIALALGAADPYVTTRAAFDDGRRSSVAIVLDDSMSMHARDGSDGRRIDDARELAMATLDALPDESEVAVVLAGDPARLVVDREAGVEAARHALRTLAESSGRGTDLAAAVDLARRALTGARYERRLVVFSDFAAHAGAESVAWPERGVDIALRRVGPESLDPIPNAAIVEARGAIDPTTPDQRSVQILAHGADGEARLSIRGPDDAVFAEATVSPSGDALRHTLHLPAQRDPFAMAVLADLDDVLPIDDARPLLLEPPAAIRVLLVDGDPHPTPTRDEVGWLARALETSGLASAGRVLRHRIVDPDRLAQEDLASVDVVVLANVTPAPGVAAALREFVASGGGLLVATGGNVDPRALTSRLGPVLPAHLEARRGLEGDAGALGRAEGSSVPLPRLRPARVHHLHPLDTRPGAEVLVRSADGSAVLALGTHGEGRCALFGTTLDDDGTDLPYHPGYVAFATELLRALAGTREGGHELIAAGTAASAPPRARQVRLPGGERLPVRPARGDELRETDAPGIYAWLDEDDEVVGRFAVHAPAAESDLQPGALPEIRGANDDGRAGRSRRPLGRWFFLLAGALLLAAGNARGRGVRGRGPARPPT